jgi:NADPH:quinone reductase-like Zn-dependent oxidoreductase
VARWGQAGIDNKFGALQKNALALEENTLRLEPEITLEDASGVIANLATVVSALNIYMGLSLPPVTGRAQPNGKRILVYGGSSAVGGLAEKYATDAGYEVVTTSSTANKKLVEERNAAHIIDHSQPKEDILRELRAHGPYEGIFEAIGSQTTTQLIVELLRETGGHFSQPVLLPVMIIYQRTFRRSGLDTQRRLPPKKQTGHCVCGTWKVIYRKL